MSELIVVKELAGNMPSEGYIPNGIYLLRSGIGFDLKVADSTGTFLHTLNIEQKLIYNSDGLVTKPLKEWYGMGTAVEGTWTIDYSSANFSKILNIVATPMTKSNSYKAEDGNFTSIDETSITLTGASGKANNAVAAGLLVGTVSVNANCNIYFRVLGE